MKEEIRDNPFGVLAFLAWNHSWNNYKYSGKDLEKAVSLMKECGISFVRMDFLWNDIESKQGEFNFAKYDNIVNLLTDNEIQILGLLSYIADWAGSSWNSPPYNNKTFVNYVSKVIDRYKDKVKYWEIWNEPDDEQYWTPQDNMIKYTALLKEVYTTAKKISSVCKILNGGLSRNIPQSLKEIYKNNGGKYFDILAIHVFVHPKNKADVRRILSSYNICKQIMKENNEDKKIWFTELGCPGVKSSSQIKNWWAGDNSTEEQQAELVKKVYTGIIMEMPDCDKVFWAFFRDCLNHWNNGIDYFGLIRWDFSKKPAFNAYQNAVKLWDESLKYKNPAQKKKLR